jgi:hypothetical protein
MDLICDLIELLQPASPAAVLKHRRNFGSEVPSSYLGLQMFIAETACMHQNIEILHLGCTILI